MTGVAKVVAADKDGDDFPIFLKIDVRVGLHFVYQQSGLLRHVTKIKQYLNYKLKISFAVN